VGLDGPDLVRADVPEPFQAVPDASPMDLLEGRKLVFGGGDDELPAQFERDAVLPAELEQHAVAVPAVPGLRLRAVVDPAVDDPAVVPVWWAAMRSSFSTTRTRSRASAS
jgi:hypothetical protein